LRDELLAAPFVDTRARDLVWSLDPQVTVPAPLATLTVRGGGLEIDLHLLGASHRVELRGPSRLVETVACLPGGRTGLPPSARHENDHLRYDLRTSVSRPRPGSFGVAVDRLLAALPDDALVGRFAGERFALTALTAAVGRSGDGSPSAHWSSWHVYPQTSEIVETRSEVLFVGATPGHQAAERPGPDRDRTDPDGAERLLVR